MKNAILIVDDSRLNRETLADILKDKYNIIEAEDGRSGLEVLEKRKDDIVLVILDIVMPGMDGFAFMEEARTRESIRNIPIVVATTENDYQTEKRCLELGVWDFIPKVFQPEIIRFRVLNTIKRSMAHSLEHDGLTGLYTIQKFSQCVKRNLENNQDTKFTFIRLDIERFKMINNFYGVEAGDRLLVYISGLIETYWQDVENCVFGRIDGDVFGICFPKDEKKLNGFILYIKRELKKYKAAYYLETAMGIYDILDNNLDVRNIIARATLAAKQCKGQYMIHEARYTEELRAKIIREQNIINEMEHALETGEFVVYFQPKYELDHCRPSGAEALVRWKKADGTIVSPGDFIPVFESNGFIIRLDYYVWDQVCQFIKNNLAHRGDSEVISVNVSRVNLYNPDFLESLVNLVEKYKIPPKYLNLEDILAFCGAAPVMLRREDISLHDPEAGSLKEKKSSDLRNRTRAVQDLSGATLISVHQNSYPESRYDGAQVFYAPTEGSQALAEYTQEILRQTLDPDNGRQAKQIPDTVYLMNHIDNRAILVECGFLSNPQEAARLRDPVYQTKIAAALASACLTFQGERITAHTTEI